MVSRCAGVTTGVSLVISVATIATFTFYIAADFPRLQRGLLSWFDGLQLDPSRQRTKRGQPRGSAKKLRANTSRAR